MIGLGIDLVQSAVMGAGGDAQRLFPVSFPLTVLDPDYLGSMAIPKDVAIDDPAEDPILWPIVRNDSSVWAADFVGLDVSQAAYIWDLGGAVFGAYLGLRESPPGSGDMRLVFRYGDGDAEDETGQFPDNCAYVVVDPAPIAASGGTGTLVWAGEFSTDSARLWWNGQELTGRSGTWDRSSIGGTDKGCFLGGQGGQVPSGETTYLEHVADYSRAGWCFFYEDQEIGDAALPAQVAGLAATGSDGLVELSWTASVGDNPAVSGYRIERQVGGVGAFVLLATQAGTTYDDFDVENGTLYTYRVSAVSQAGAGPASAEASATPSAYTPALSAVDAEGWRATVASPAASYDPIASPVYVLVQSPGFSGVATPTTVTRNISLTGRIDLIAPDNGTLTPDQVSMAQRVYAGDTVVGATNNSTYPHMRPQVLWLTPDYERCDADTFTVDIFVAHAHATNGTPVAGVRFIATDQHGNSTSADEAAQTVASWAASGKYAPIYRGTIDTTGLTPGDQITVDAIIYPHIGEAYQISVSGDAYGTGPNTSVLRFLNDRTGAYNALYAYVDPAATGTPTPVVSPTPATAAAAPYADIGLAMRAMAAANSSLNGRSNLSGCILRLTTGAHPLVVANRYDPVGDPAMDCLFVIEAADGATASIEQSTTLMSANIPTHTKISGVTINATTDGNLRAINNEGDNFTNRLVFYEVVFASNGKATTGAFMGKTGRKYLINCSGDDLGQTDRFASVSDHTVSIGCDGPWPLSGMTVSAVGCKQVGKEGITGDMVDMQSAVGRVIAFSECWRANALGGVGMEIQSHDPGDAGYAFIGSFIENADPTFNSSGSSIGIWGDGAANTPAGPILNVNMFASAMYGEDIMRLNTMYNDSADRVRGHTMRGNIWVQYNTKGDTFEGNGSVPGPRYGNQDVRYHVNKAFNVMAGGTTGVPAYDYYGSYGGDIESHYDHFGTIYNGNPVYLEYADPKWSSNAWAGPFGGGDYRIEAGYLGPTWPAGQAPHKCDQYGTLYANDGSDVPGPRLARWTQP